MKTRSKFSEIVLYSFLFIFSITANAIADIKSSAIDAWKGYFQDIHSLQYEYKVSDRKGKPLPNLATNTKFYLNGLHYRSEMTFNSRYMSLQINTYDGKQYQSLKSYSGGTQLSYSKKLRTNYPYNFIATPLELFFFAFNKNDIINFATLQNPTQWKNVAKRVEYLRTETRNQRKGYVFKVTGGMRSDFVREVFVDTKTFFPFEIKFTSLGTNASGSKTIMTSKTIVSTVTSWKGSGGTYYFPLKFTTTTSSSGVQDQVLSIVPQTLKINKPINEDIFILPKSQATVIIDEEQYEKDMQESKSTQQKRTHK